MKRLVMGCLALAACAWAAAPVPYFQGNVEEVLTRATQENKRVVVSLGREVCGRCQKFYRLLAEDKLAFDTAKCIYLKLNVDDLEQREYVYSWFEIDDNRLPYVGVLDPNARTGTCQTAACNLEDLKKLFGTLALPTPKAQVCTKPDNNIK